MLICISFTIMIKLILIIRFLLSLICGNALFIFSNTAMIFIFFLSGNYYVISFGYIEYYLIKIVLPETYRPNYYLTLLLWKLQSS